MIKEYKCHQLHLKKINKKYKLPYLYSQFQKLEDQEYKYISRLRRIGKKLKRKNGIWYLLVSKRKFSLSTKLRVIEKIFNIKESTDITIYEAIKHNLEKIAVKTSTSLNYNNYINILDVLALYLISDGYDYDILNNLKVLKIQRYEVSNDLTLKDVKDKYFRGYNLNKATEEEVKNFQLKHKKATKRWKNSKTYKLNEVLRKFDKKASKWCYVDTTNSFYFNNKKFNIDDIDQYKVKNDNQCEMDFILVLEDSFNELYFFDMNIESLNKNKIIERDD